MSTVDDTGTLMNYGNCMITFTATSDFTASPWTVAKPMAFLPAASTCDMSGATAAQASCYTATQGLLLDSKILTMHSSSTVSLAPTSSLSVGSYQTQDASWYECFSTISLVTPGSTLTAGSAVDTWAYEFPGINYPRYFTMNPTNGGYCGNTGDDFSSNYVNRSLGDLSYNADLGFTYGSCFNINRGAYTTAPLMTTTYNATHLVRTVSSMENFMNNFLCSGGAGCSCTLVYVAACYPGTFSSDGKAASGACTACAAGSISGVGATSCTPCPVGTYTTDAQTCNACPASTFSGVGATSCTPFATLLGLLNNVTASLASLQVNVSSTAASCAAASG